MKIEVRKFGDLLISRPAGHEAFLAAKAYVITAGSEEKIKLDFTGVKVLAPSWADEIISGLKSEYGPRIVCLPSTNPTVIESLKLVLP